MINTRLMMGLCAFVTLTTLGFAQVSVPGFIEIQDYHTSNSHAQEGNETGSVYRKIYHHPNAGALRVVFGAYVLGPNDWIEVYSPTTGERHKLNNAEMTKWRGSSGFFNGDTLWIDLYLAPGSTGSFDIVSYFACMGGITSGDTSYGYQTICGVDDRIASTDNRSARFVSSNLVSGGGCTIWLASADGCAISAGHCFSSGSLQLAEFNCPPSLSNGSLQHPPIADQFPIDPTTVSFTNGGVGNDWGVCRMLTNNLGQEAHVLHGFHNVVASVPSINETIRITGFGVDGGIENQTNQTHTGPLVGNTGTALGYQVDTTGGNSGSPVINDTTGNAVGIHTHGGCSSTGTGNNSGTSTSHTGFQAALSALCNLVPMVPVASFTNSTSMILDGQSVTFNDTTTGVPLTWDWDFDGDNITDATTASATFQYNTPGLYDVRLTVTNGLGSDTITMPALITVNAIMPTSVPYTQDFSGGLPTSGEWVFSSIGATGRIQASSFGTNSPISGAPSLVMDSSINQNYATNQAALFIDLATTSGAMLRFWFKESNDEPDPEDGVFLSDGTTEIQLLDLGDGPQDWTLMTVNITDMAANAGLVLTTDMRIIFRQRDNYSLSSDGHLIDDIHVSLPTTPDSGQSNAPLASLTSVGMLDINGFTPVDGQVGPFFVDVAVGQYLDLDIQGPPLGFMAMYAGQLNRANASFPGNGQLDIGLLGPVDFSDITVVLDGINPTTLVDTFGILTAGGQQRFAAIVPPIFAPGSTFALQVLVTPGLQLTAAIQVTIQ
ncbi:MAG: PKD repeat protein [Planctomycetota bacterium]|jgi:PKD repeat protein